ncbi:MAG: tetratricopeptide repeat protein [Limisphaerales bacterium]
MHPTRTCSASCHLLAALSLSLLLLSGCGGSSGFKSLKAKAEKGDPQAQLELAQMHLYGKGAKQDHVEAIKWCEKAAAKGLPAAQRTYGVMLRDGYGVDRNIAKGREWLAKAVEQGDAEAKVELAATPVLPAAGPPRQ